MKNFFLYWLVSVVGAVVLALEILGTRVLGPFYGVSIFLWSALISVTLAALSLGYMLGGKMADKNASLSRLSLLLLISGVWILLIPWIRHPFLTLAEPLGLRTAVLVAAFILFFPPLMLLGMVNPFAIKLKATSLETIGKTAGNLNAISTLASVVSALLTGYVLIPNVGVTALLLILGFLLLITAIVGSRIEKKSKLTRVSAIMLILFAGLIFRNNPEVLPNPSEGLLAIEESSYGELRVLDIEEQRHLLIDGGIHSRADTSTWRSSVHYCAVMELPKYFFDEPGTALVIGLGGGSLVKQYDYHSWQVDAVEIDPVVISMAEKYFGLSRSEANLFEMDGRQFLQSTQKKYDVIMLDAFGSSSIPFHLCTNEAYQLLSSRLVPNGILAVNIETKGWDDPIISTFTATLKSVFQNVLVLPIEEPPSSFGNVVLLASQQRLEPKRVPEDNVTYDPAWRYGPGYQKVHAWDNRFIPKFEHATILTDDKNPVDVRAEEINYAARKELHEYFAHYKVKMSW
ncbi:MAG: fused MFS/spermidine synthase [Ignavibacteriae bacterium]|nr:fused MFS/spermidine synthase [Ignavibacteriota bacterium]